MLFLDKNKQFVFRRYCGNTGKWIQISDFAVEMFDFFLILCTTCYPFLSYYHYFIINERLIIVDLPFTF